MENKFTAKSTDKPIKIFKPLVDAVLNALKEIFIQNRKADKALAGILKSNNKWGARDRGFIAENTYEIVRNWRLIKFCAGFEGKKIETDFDFMKIIATWLVINELNIENLDYFPNIDTQSILDNFAKAQLDRKIKFSVPDWMDALCENELGQNWAIELEALSQKADVYLRANTLKITKEKLIIALEKLNIETTSVAYVKDAIKLVKRSNVFGLEEFKKGLFEVQDAGSQLISEFLNVTSGQRIIDACAGAGGKSLHLATIMGNKGKVIAMDVEDFKLIELKKRAKRNGIDTIETRLIEAKTLKRLKSSADKLLLDVPCSGLGVLKRNPDAKWKLKPEFIEEIKLLQAQILSEYSAMVKVGGQMVYATCSILKSENEDQVQQFLVENNNFKLIKEQRLSPAKDGFDGFYMALLEKIAEQIS